MQHRVHFGFGLATLLIGAVLAVRWGVLSDNSFEIFPAGVITVCALGGVAMRNYFLMDMLERGSLAKPVMVLVNVMLVFTAIWAGWVMTTSHTQNEFYLNGWQDMFRITWCVVAMVGLLQTVFVLSSQPKIVGGCGTD
ncbi:MAG: hypothetical protein JWM39_422 [Parcubacteria group bacterium]|nr:hypothetical protein [Parcubacteria group bacterium]